MNQHLFRRLDAANCNAAATRSAGFHTCRIADFQTGKLGKVARTACLESPDAVKSAETAAGHSEPRWEPRRHSGHAAVAVVAGFLKAVSPLRSATAVQNRAIVPCVWSAPAAWEPVFHHVETSRPRRRRLIAGKRFGLESLWIGVLGASLCAGAHAQAAGLVAAWGHNTFGQTRLPQGTANIKAISAVYHNLALKNDGTVVAWGSNLSGECNVPAGLGNVKAVAAGHTHSLALKADGTVVAWGDDYWGQTNVPAALSGVVAIAAGGGHSVALRGDGSLAIWGYSLYGKTNIPPNLGPVKAISAGPDYNLILKSDGTIAAWGDDRGGTNIPPNLASVIAIAAGYDHGLALKADGSVVAWGSNSQGQTNVPPTLANVTAIAAGIYQSLALTADGNVVVWGQGGVGGITTNLPPGLTNVQAVAAGYGHNLAIVPAGPVQIVTGPESQGGLINSSATFSVTATGWEPMTYQWLFHGLALSNSVRVSGTTTATLSIADLQLTDAGLYSTVVSNAFGSVMSSGAVLTVLIPPFITSQSPNQTVGAGTFVTLSVTADGTPPLSYQWTFNGTNLPGKSLSNLFLSNAQPEASGDYTVIVSNAFGTASATLGLVVTNRSPIITQQPFLTTTNLRTTVTSPVPPGSSVALNVSATGSLPLRYQWRFNGGYLPGATNATLLLEQLNLNQSGFYSVDVSNAFGKTNSVKVLLNVSQVAVAGAPLADNPNMPLGLSDVTALAAGGSHVVALKTDGTVRAWLVNSNYISDQAYAVTNVPGSATNVIAIAAGRSHCLALRSNGTVLAWGPSTGGQTNVPTSLSNVISIAAGSSRSYAVKADGTVTGWGSAATVPAGLSNVVAVTAGPSQNLALRRDGTVAHWMMGTGTFTMVPGLSNAIAIAASYTDRALRADGTVVTWPGTSVTTPTPVFEGRFPVSNVVAIAVGSGVSLILKQDGTLVADRFPTGVITVSSNLNAIAAGGVQTGFGVMLLGNGAPAITLEPFSQIVTKSNPVLLHARSVGTPVTTPQKPPTLPPLRFQWQLDGANLPGATNASLILSNVLTQDTGGYRLIASNALGTATSRVATISIAFNTNLAAALNATNLIWSSVGTTNWFAQNRETHDGDVAAQSGAIANSQQSLLQTTITGPGTLTFWWKVSSEEGFDFLRFYLDSTQTPLASLSGENDWEQRTIRIGTGTHTVRWIYSKDVSVSAGRDAGWLDEVVFTPDPPVITQQPVPSRILPAGTSTTCSLAVSGVGPFSYQWLKDGASLPGATKTSLVLTNLTRRDSATYRARVSNAGGSVTSSNATLKVIVQQRLGSIHLAADGSTEILSRDADGGLLLPEDLPSFDAEASTNLVTWEALPNVLSLANGSLVLHDPGSTNFPVRFYRMVEH